MGDGLNRWPAVHRLDAAHLYRLVLEKGSAGTRYHGVANEGVPFRDIAGVIGHRLGVPVVTKSSKDAAGHFSLIVNHIWNFFDTLGLPSVRSPLSRPPGPPMTNALSALPSTIAQ